MKLAKPIFAKDLYEIYSPAKALGGDTFVLSDLLNPIIQNILTISAIAAFITLIFAGFNFITSAGDEKKLQQSSHMINYALIGLLLIASAWLITKIIGSLFGYDFF